MNHVKLKERTYIPSKVICVGRNYTEHIEELGNETPENMVLFNKPNSAITDELHYFNDACRFEGELCLLIEEGKISAVGLGLDLTHADIQNKMKSKGLPWERAKAFDASAVLSQFVALECEISTLSFELRLNGQLQQFADYGLMIYKPDEILEEIETFMTLRDGDIIMTGTPKGVTNYSKGDSVEMSLFSGKKEILSTSWSAL